MPVIETYASARDRLHAAIADLVDVAADRRDGATLEGASALGEQLDESRFNVVVFGAFKRGKTTFVNALLGADVLPAAVVPLTSVVTVIAWGPEVRARIEYLDGRSQDVAVAELARYVTEPGNPENRLGVTRAMVSYPSDELRDGVRIVDTPGVGSVYEHNTDTARSFLAESDAAVFITSADPPISEAERAFLSDVREHSARLFFVLNKVDYLSGDDRDEAIAFTRRVIQEALGKEVAVFPMSARAALVGKVSGDDGEVERSGFVSFERAFRRFLLDEKGEAILESVAGRGLRLVDDERNGLGIEERALELSAEQISDARARMEQVFDDARVRQERTHALLRHATEGMIARLDEDLARMRIDETARLLRLATDRMAERGDVRGIGEEIDALAKDALRADLERWRRDEEGRLTEALRGSTTRLIEEADASERETVRLCGEILGIELLSEGTGVDLSPHTSFSFSFFEAPTILESLLPDVRRFLPRGTARRMLERDMKERIPSWVDKHSGRLRWDFLQRIEQTRRELALALDRRLEATISSLTASMERSRRDQERSEEDAARERARIASLRRRLDDLRSVFLGAASLGMDGARSR